MILNSEIGQRIKLLLVELRKTQKQLAIELKYKNPSGLSEVVQGRVKFNEWHLDYLENTYHVNRNWLLYGGDEPMLLEKPRTNQILTTQTTEDMESKNISELIAIIKQQQQSIHGMIAIQKELVSKLPDYSHLGEWSEGRKSSSL